MAVVESAGSTSLDQDVGNHYVVGGSVTLLYRGLPVFAGQFGTWVPRGVERIGGVYKLVWQNGSGNEFVIWDVDSSGNFLSQTATMIRTDPLLVSLEPGFNQDLSASSGIASNFIIEANGSTQLNSVATGATSAYILSPTGSTLGPQLKYNGALVASGQFGSWTPLGAELVGTVYKIVWKSGSSDYIVWDVDSSGNWLSQTTVLTGSSAMIRSLEAVFNQDLNSSASIEAGSIIESAGLTRLTSIDTAYVLSPNGSTLGPQLKYGGALVATNQFSGWAPVGAEQTSGGYQVVWQNGTQFIVWNVDSNGNWLSQSAALAANSLDVQLLEVGFGQNFNGVGGTLSRVAIETSGSTALATIGGSYYGLSPNGSTLGPQLKYGGALVTTTQFSGWTPIGAEQTSGGYQVVWQNTNQFIVWNVDGSGNWLSQSAAVAGSNVLIQTLEPGFAQDLGGGGTASRVVIESSGSTTLASIASTWYVLSSSGSALGQTLKYGGSAVVAGQFGAWTPIAAEMSGGMYRMVWRNGAADQYLAWNVDANGNYVSQGAVVSANTWSAQSYETVVQFDINGNGTIGAIVTPMESTGNTTLSQAADSYFFNYGSANIQVRMGGAYVAVNQFGSWTPRAVELSGGMYRLAWKNGAADQYVAWNIDAGGNYVSQGATVSGSTWWLQSYEPIVQFDLNSDGLIGPTLTAIESSGLSTLTKVADSYFVNYGSAPVQVMYGGSYAGSNQFPNWTAVGAEQTIGGYMVAWRNSSNGQYTVWNTDGSGNLSWNSANITAGTSLFSAVEASMQQDLNGGGIASKSTVEGSGSTALYNIAGYLEMVRGPYTGPLLANADSSYVTAGQFGTAMGAEWIGNGYRVAWKTGTDSFNFWTTDFTGRYASQTGNLAGSSAQMQAYEPTFNQDLNGDGVIGVNNTPFSIQIVFSGNSAYQSYFTQAAARWERIIRADLPAVISGTYGTIDDLRIDASVAYIDGTNGVLAQAGWDLRRSGSTGLPYHGIMRFDSSDITSMVNNGTFLDVVTHEMGHVLGIGTLWSSSYFGYISGSSYTGQYANAAYHQLGGSGLVPLETGGGSGTAFAHWSEARFDRELLTGYSETSSPMPLSIVTVGALQDLGYTVDYGAADGYSLPAGLQADASTVVDDSGMGGLDAIGGSSMLAHDATGGSDTLAFNDAYDGSLVVDDRGQASNAGILTDFVDTDDGAANDGAGLADLSLLTTYMANSFVTSPGEGAGNVGITQATTEDVLARPYA